ncbi:E domain-containing protein [Staphylococcus aureus]|nr:E domain-containing protein [Staphylococcus aureus]
MTKQPVDKIVEFGGEKIPQGHKDIFDPNLPTDQTEKYQVNQESRIQTQEK